MQSAWYRKQITKQLKYAAENKWHGDLFTNGENLTAKPHWVIFRSPLPKLHYYHNKRLQVKESQVPYQPIVESLSQYLIGLVL